MVTNIKSHLDTIKSELKELEQKEKAAKRLTAIDGQLIYLHGRNDQKQLWEETGRALEEKGLVVFPSEPDPVVNDPAQYRELSNTRIKTLSACDALLLLGTNNGRALDADLVVVGRQDRQSARAISNRFLPCALLDHKWHHYDVKAQRETYELNG